MKTTRLYYEAHITVRPHASIPFTMFAQRSEELGWKASKFDEDEVDHYKDMWFLSNRNTELNDIRSAVLIQHHWLVEAKFDIIRWKIEDTLFDSKHGDSLGDL